MTGRIYQLNDDATLIPMEEMPYDSERLLQELLAKHPDLLAGEQINSEAPRRWLLVKREMRVPDEEDGGGRWSLDHLFLDQDAVPTLVEVKRSSDTRIRRKVVGQMLDYAANAVAYWPVEEIRSEFERRCEKLKCEPGDELEEFLAPDQNADEFWQRVKTNLQAGRIRMVFLADVVPAELRRIVEFLNEQMDPAEVLAVEVRQFVGEGTKTLVPRVLGQTEAARKKKGGGGSKPWDRSSFMAAVCSSSGQAAAKAAEELLDWITPQVSEVWFGSGAKLGGIVAYIRKGRVNYHVCRMNTRGQFVFRFDWLRKKPPFNDEAVLRELLAKINEIPGIRFDDEKLKKRVPIPFSRLADRTAMAKLKAAAAWLIEKINETPVR